MMTRRAAADELARAGAERTRRLADIGREAETWRARRASAGERLAHGGYKAGQRLLRS